MATIHGVCVQIIVYLCRVYSLPAFGRFRGVPIVRVRGIYVYLHRVANIRIFREYHVLFNGRARGHARSPTNVYYDIIHYIF